MAKAVRTARGNPPPRRPQPGMATAGADRRQTLVEYFRGVAIELGKVVWPARDELLRMTGIVIATVLLFGVLIGAADYVLSLGISKVYSSSAAATPTAAPATTAIPTITAPATTHNPTPLP